VIDLYRLLGLPPAASDAEVAAAYERERSRVLAAHAAAPDLGERLQALDDAYAALSGPGRQALAVAEPGAAPGLPTVAAPSGRACQSCGAANPEQASGCLRCGSQFTRSCPRCSRPVAIETVVCGRCGVVIQEYDRHVFGEAVATEHRTLQDRQRSEIRVASLEAGHHTRAWQSAIFWVVAFLLFWGLIALTVVLLGFGN
jgi:hypothetical protein